MPRGFTDFAGRSSQSGNGHDGTFGPMNFEMSLSPDRPLNDAERDRMDAVLSGFVVSPQ
jgi:hypothetical protein